MLREDEVVRAAGGVVLRDGNVLLVHRPRYDDWTLPKGKCKRRESDEDCALREVEEETGLRCELGRRIGETRYLSQRGPKVVQWFELRPIDGSFTPGDEVDEIEWVQLAEAPRHLTYERDAELLARL